MNILIVSPFFAPVSSVGAVRMTSLAAYLTKEHKVTVFALSIATIEREYAHIIKSKPLGGVEYAVFSVKDIYRYPDFSEIGLIQNRLEEVIKTHSFDIVLVTSGPVYTQGIVDRVCKKYKIPYILDMRDLDLLDYYFSVIKGRGFVKIKRAVTHYVKKQIERKACLDAAKVTVANPAHAEMLADAYHLNAAKIVPVLNGYDDVRFASVSLRESSEDGFTIGCFGKLSGYDEKRALRLLQIVDKLHSKYGKVSIKHVGEDKDTIERLIAENKLDPSIYQGMGFLDYSDGIAEMSSCNMYAMIFVHPNSLGTKIFDYLVLNKPIVNIAPPGIALEKLVGDLHNVLFSDDDEEVYAFIERMMNKGISTADSGFDVSKYARTNSNKQFEALMYEVLKK